MSTRMFRTIRQHTLLTNLVMLMLGLAIASESRAQIVFQEGGILEPGIWKMNSDGTNRVRLTISPQNKDWGPAWNKSRTKIAFVSSASTTGRPEIFVMNANGSGRIQLTFTGVGSNEKPSWSPDGTKIAFQSNRDGDNEIFVMNANGSGQRQLTFNTADCGDPSWSPDGTMLVFYTNVTGNYEIFKMNAAGGGFVQLTNNSVKDYSPAWSPDGTRIAFSRIDSCGSYQCYGDVWTMNTNGASQTRVTKQASIGSYAHTPSWSPDGTKIVFTNCIIWVTNADGSGTPTRLLFHGVEFDPAWYN